MFPFVNFYNKFIYKQTVLTFLYDLTVARISTKSVHFLPTHVKSFNKIQSRRCAALRLAHLNLVTTFRLITKAFKIVVGAVFYKRDVNGVNRVIFFFY